jgi:MoxR-like ATPase
MPRKAAAKGEALASASASRGDDDVLRQPAERRYAQELSRLAAADKDARPPGWLLSARSVRRFIIGDEVHGITRKFYGDDALVDRAIVTLISAQGLMLIGEPGTAKSMLSELLAAAVCGSSDIVVQGSAGTTEDHVRYSWNYALLLAKGPTEAALVPSPVLTAMRSGRIVRIEELTRCPPEIQDTMISTLSEKVIAIPELGEAAPGSIVRARPGFNVIATANMRDRGVHEMSSALKRRFNFETVHPIADPELERTLIERQVAERVPDAGQRARLGEDALDLIVSTFQELRAGRSREGVQMTRPEAVMSTAEAVHVAHAALLEAMYLGTGDVAGQHVVNQLHGVVIKDNAEDAKKLRAYFEHVAKPRAADKAHWRDFYEAARRQRLG